MTTKCKACGLTQETRTAYCASKSGKIYNETFCANRKVPELNRKCNQTTVCEYQWFSSQWSKCSVDCGTGVQTRNVVCGKFEKGSMTSAEDESKCEANEQPATTKECDTGKLCDGQWFAGPWSECNKRCGGGKRTRKVLCIAIGEPVAPAKCGEDTIAFSTEDCNKDPCVDDELLPLDTTAKSIEEDDEGEEWCDEIDESSNLELIDIESSSPIYVSASYESSSSSLFTEELMQSDSAYSMDSRDGTPFYCT